MLRLIPQYCLTHVIHIRDKAERYMKTRVAVAYSPQSRKLDDAPWKHMRVSSTLWLSERALCWRKLSVCRRHENPTNWHIPITAAAFKLQQIGNFEEDEQTDCGRFLCSSCCEEYISGTTFCRCSAKQKNSTEDQERKTQATLEDGRRETQGSD